MKERNVPIAIPYSMVRYDTIRYDMIRYSLLQFSLAVVYIGGVLFEARDGPNIRYDLVGKLDHPGPFVVVP